MKLKGLSDEETKEVLSDGNGNLRNLILLGYRGSIAHGTYLNQKKNENSIDDKDVMGVFLGTERHYTGFEENKVGEKMFREWDIVQYELKKFVSLLLKNNPNVLMLLWLPEKYYLHKDKYGEMLIQNRDIFVSKYAYHSFSGYAYSQFKRMTNFRFEGYMGEKRKKLVDRFGYDCYTDDTEFLTETGWKKYDEIEQKDRLATIFISELADPNYLERKMGHRKCFGVEYQYPIERFDTQFSGSLYNFIGNHIDVCVTPNHRMLYRKVERKSRKVYPISLDYAFRMPDSFDFILTPNPKTKVYKNKFLENIPIPITAYLTIAGWFLSDGSLSVRKNKTKPTTIKSIRISQKEGGKLSRGMSRFHNKYKSIINSSLYKYKLKKKYPFGEKILTEWILDIRHKNIVNSIYSHFGRSEDKHIPQWMFEETKRKMKCLLYGLLGGDGSLVSEKHKSYIYHTSSKKLADDVQRLAFMCGYVTSLDGPYTSLGFDGTGRKMYQVYINTTAKQFHSLVRSRTLRKIDVKNKRIVCFTVSNGTLITRRNGKIGIHGNCKNASHLIRLLKMGIEFLTEGNLHVEREDAPQLISIKNGEWTLEQVKREAEKLFKLSQEAYIHSPLKDKPDYEKAEQLVMNIIKEYLISKWKGET